MAEVKALIVRLEADINDLKAGMAQASGEVQKFSQQTNAVGTSALRNWRMANQMGDSFRGVALSMGGLRGQGAMAIGMLDNIGDYFERAKLRGLSFRDALKNLSGEMSMMLSAGIIYGLMQAFNALQKSIEDVNKILIETDKRWDSIAVKLYERKLKDLKKAYDDGKISAIQYKEAAERLNESIIKAKYQEEITKTTEAINKLTKAQEQNAILSIALSSSQAGNLLSGILGADVDAKLAAFRAKLTALQADLKMDVEAASADITTTLDKDAKQQLKDRERFTKAEYELDRKWWDKRTAEEQERNRSNRAAQIAQINELNRIKREADEATAAAAIAQAENVNGYYRSAAGSIASLTVALLQQEANAWKNWANQVIAEIERVIAKELILAAIKGIFGLGPGGFIGWGEKLGSIFGSPASGLQTSIQIITADPSTVVRVVNNAYASASPGSQARLSQVVARGNIANTKR